MNQSRRSFLRNASLVAAGAGCLPSEALAIASPVERVGASRIRLSLAAYSFRDYFAYSRGKRNPEVPEERRMDMKGFLRYCAKHGCGGAELTSYFFEPEVTNGYLTACRHLAHTTGVEISGTAVGNNFSHPQDTPQRASQMTYVQQWIDRAVLLGAPHIRVFAGVHPKGVSAEDAERNAIEALEEAGEYAGRKGVLLGIENHDSISTADRLLRIVKGVKSPWVGVNLDTGNFRSDDPYADMEASAPYAVNVQFKVQLRVGGTRQASDLPRVIRLLRDAGYQGYFVLEYEESDPYGEVPAWLEKIGALCDG